MKQFLRKIFVIFVGLVALEFILRIVGFGAVPLYYESASFEYALQPSQDLNRFGNHFYINEHGMRSMELKEGSFRILKIGDSVLNGGVGTDQKELASQIVEDSLKSILPGLQVLNISAGSWEPDNAFAWISEFGHFDAEIIVLVFSSHDWSQQMKFKRYVDNVPFYPSKQPALAITDAFSWIYARTLLNVDWDSLPNLRTKPVSKSDHNMGWDRFYQYHRQHSIPLIVYHHPSRDEIIEGEWSQDGKKLQNFLSEKNIPTISGLNASLTSEDYRDEIHPNKSGQRKMANALIPILKQTIENSEDR
jgi:hypothetical protein